MQKNSIKNIPKCIRMVVFSGLMLAACIPAQSSLDTSVGNSTSITESPTLEPSLTATTAPTPPHTPDPRQNVVCSPLEGETLDELPEIMTQDFFPPRPGQDVEGNDHHGLDFAFYRRKDMESIEGLGVLSALDGEVVTVINDRYPYGYGLIIETPLKTLSDELLIALAISEPQPTVAPAPKFNFIPGEELSFELSETERSLYIFYAHFKYLPEINIGEEVTCGQRIGQVGNTGDSTNAHLHFETRIGPSGARFESMAYYTLQSTAAERYNYVIWRVTNLFQLINPKLLLFFDK